MADAHAVQLANVRGREAKGVLLARVERVTGITQVQVHQLAALTKQVQVHTCVSAGIRLVAW